MKTKSFERRSRTQSIGAKVSERLYHHFKQTAYVGEFIVSHKIEQRVRLQAFRALMEFHRPILRLIDAVPLNCLRE